jgi:signal transduction histidine kinase
MTLFTGILKEELAGDERAAHADKIAREVGYLERVVNEFLDYARRPPLERADVDVAAVFADVVEVVVGPAIAIEVADPPPKLRADPTQLRRALLNLVQNAVQAASKASGEVRLVARADGDDVVIEVHNTGPEIPADVRDKIFEPFYTTREKGTGLGLAFVREIVHDHDGKVDVTSANGRTCFRVTLPGR